MKFYVLEPEEGIRFGRKWAYADVLADQQGDFEHCPVCDGPVTPLKSLPPHQINLSSAKPEKWGDFTWGAGFLLMVSGRFKLIYERTGLKGIKKFFSPTEIVRFGNLKRQDLPAQLPTYHVIDIVWNGANQDDAASEVTLEHPEKVGCSFCRVGAGSGLKQSRIVLEPESWTGDDIFTPRGAPVELMVSERFKDVMEEHGMKNSWFIPAEKFVYDSRRPGLWYVNE